MTALSFGSVCSGIEAASVAFGPLGWHAAWFSEIEPFPCAVLAHHYPDVPNHGDMTTLVGRILSGKVDAPDLLCGGTPCQAFSVAGHRQSLDDARGNLTLTFVEIADAIDHVRAARGDDPCIVLWENVPGVLSTRDNAFGCFLGALAGAGCELQPPGGRWSNAGCVHGPARTVAWRVLDAQYFGLAQRRRRVFVVASPPGSGLDPLAVLFESEGVRRDHPPRREAGKGTSDPAGGGIDGGRLAGAVTSKWAKGTGGPAGDECYNLVAAEVTGTLATGGGGHAVPGTSAQDAGGGFLVAHTLRGEGFDASEDGTGCGTPIIPIDMRQASRGGTMTNNRREGTSGGAPGTGIGKPGDPAPTISTSHTPAVAFAHQGGGIQTTLGYDPEAGTAPTLSVCQTPAVHHAMAVRRLTPRECERLQGFPDDHTRIPWRRKPAEDCPDGPRYKALGNSWAVKCVRWIGERIDRQLAVRP